jgi:putative ABC transport system substrate-binding protein
MKKAAVGSILVVVLLFAVAVIAQAQQPVRTPARIGYLSPGTRTSESARSEAIRQALRELGYIEGPTIATEYRYTEEKLDRAPELAAELVSLKVDVLGRGRRKHTGPGGQECDQDDSHHNDEP